MVGPPSGSTISSVTVKAETLVVSKILDVCSTPDRPGHARRRTRSSRDRISTCPKPLPRTAGIASDHGQIPVRLFGMHALHQLLHRASPHRTRAEHPDERRRHRQLRPARFLPFIRRIPQCRRADARSVAGRPPRRRGPDGDGGSSSRTTGIAARSAASHREAARPSPGRRKTPAPSVRDSSRTSALRAGRAWGATQARLVGDRS